MTVNFPTSTVTPSVKPFENLGFDPIKPPTISAASTVEPEKVPEGDTIKLSATEINEAKKRTVVQGAKDLVRAMKKFGITVSEYTKGTFKGLGQSLLVAASIFTIGSASHALKSMKATKAKLPVPKKGPFKALAILGAVVTMGVNYWDASLEANRKKADVDHKYTTTPIISK